LGVRAQDLHEPRAVEQRVHPPGRPLDAQDRPGRGRHRVDANELPDPRGVEVGHARQVDDQLSLATS